MQPFRNSGREGPERALPEQYAMSVCGRTSATTGGGVHTSIGFSLDVILKSVCVVAVLLVLGCEPGDFGPLLDIPIAPVGKTRSPPFQLYRDYTYNIVIGLDPMKVDEASCAPSLIALNPGIPYPPCRELTPPHGAMSWTVTQGNKVVARGGIDASPIDVVRGRPNSWAKDKAMGWDTYGGWFGHPGKDYVIEIDVQPSPVDLAQFHPRLALVKPFK